MSYFATARAYDKICHKPKSLFETAEPVNKLLAIEFSFDKILG